MLTIDPSMSPGCRRRVLVVPHPESQTVYRSKPIARHSNWRYTLPCCRAVHHQVFRLVLVLYSKTLLYSNKGKTFASTAPGKTYR